MIKTTTRLGLLLATAALGLAAFTAPSAQAACPAEPDAVGSFGLAPGCFDAQIAANDAGDPFTQAAAHPYAVNTQFDFNTRTYPDSGVPTPWPEEPAKDIIVDVPPGLVGNPTVVPTCSLDGLFWESSNEPEGRDCPVASQVGVVKLRFPVPGGAVDGISVPLFNLDPPTGTPARFGFSFVGALILLDARLRSGSDYGISIDTATPEQLAMIGTRVTLWGVPADPIHDSQRCSKLEFGSGICSAPAGNQTYGPNSAGVPPAPLLTLPTSCPDPSKGLPFTAHTDSWWNQGALGPDGSPDPADPNWKSYSIQSHLPPSYPADPGTWGDPQGPEGCGIVPFKPTISAQPTAHSAATPTGLNVSVEVPNPGLANPDGIASSHVKKTIVKLPEGVTLNPSAGEGLGTCSPQDFARETVASTFGEGCPAESKLGTLSIESQLVERPIEGTLYLAQPDNPATSTPGAENPFDSLLALYVVAKDFQQGLLIKLPGEVQTDPATGQITTTFDDLPQLPFSRFSLHFREGGRGTLVSPPACGTYTTEAEFVPWSAKDPDNPTPSEVRHTTSAFEVTSGVGNGPCPSGGLPPFKPGLIAGSINNAAGHFSPFNVRLFRTDAEQEITHFSIKLPPGISGKLAGVPFCSDAAIEGAKAKTGAQELASPSCPKGSEVGHTLVGAGVGSVLTYVPGKVYLAGPYNGSALSIAAITAAKAGPFDLGTVVVRQALKVDPETAEVFVDATSSDPIPHIIDGITTHIRDIRAYVDRPEFTLNPTNCSRTSTASTLLGSGLDFASAIDDRPVTVSTPYQAADCAALGFKPALSLKLKGGTKRAGHPALKATLKMKPGMANIARAQVTLPKSEFLDQSHIGTVCTRVQYVKDQCPPASIYGYAKAITPILDEPLQGPVYLRSSEHKLPDLVAGLKSGKIEIDLAGRIDSVDGQIRSTFESVPDAPVSSFTLTMQGGKKGLLENSTNLCAKAHKAIVEFDGQNGKISDSHPVVRASCSKAKRKAAKRRNAR